jgi:hypothetical protein
MLRISIANCNCWLTVMHQKQFIEQDLLVAKARVTASKTRVVNCNSVNCGGERLSSSIFVFPSQNTKTCKYFIDKFGSVHICLQQWHNALGGGTFIEVVAGLKDPEVMPQPCPEADL